MFWTLFLICDVIITRTAYKMSEPEKKLHYSWNQFQVILPTLRLLFKFLMIFYITLKLMRIMRTMKYLKSFDSINLFIECKITKIIPITDSANFWYSLVRFIYMCVHISDNRKIYQNNIFVLNFLAVKTSLGLIL